jgi:putative DNA primase/helicase
VSCLIGEIFRCISTVTDNIKPFHDLSVLMIFSGSMCLRATNDGFRILAADHTENGISLGSEDGQNAIEPLLGDVDLLILDNLSTLCTTGSESASEAWIPMQNWLIGLRRKGIAVLLVHHAGTNGRQRGTSRREDALDTVIALRRPEDYLLEQGARFEVHFEKLRNRVDGDGAVSFEAKLESFVAEGHEGVRWSDHDLSPPVFKQATELFQEGLTVREVAAALHISKTEAGRMRLRALDEGLLVTGTATERLINGHDTVPPEARLMS